MLIKWYNLIWENNLYVIRGFRNNFSLWCFENIFKGEFATQTCLQGKFGEEIGSDQFGGCIMFHAPVPGANMVTGRIEYVEVRSTIIKWQ